MYHLHVHLYDSFKELKHPRNEHGEFTRNISLTMSEKSKAHTSLTSLKVIPHPFDVDIGKANPQKAVTSESVGFQKHPEGRKILSGGQSNYGKVENILLSNIYASQPAIPYEGLSKYIENLNANPELPEIGVLPNGEHWILSGHTRLGSQMLAGRMHAPVVVHHFERDPKNPKYMKKINRNRRK